MRWGAPAASMSIMAVREGAVTMQSITAS